MTVNLDDGITVFQCLRQNAINNVGRPRYTIRGASSALLMWNQVNFADNQDVPRCAASSATEKQRDRFLAVSWKEMPLQRLVLSVGDAQSVCHGLSTLELASKPFIHKSKMARHVIDPDAPWILLGAVPGPALPLFSLDHTLSQVLD
jgi:hypothetical protein